MDILKKNLVLDFITGIDEKNHSIHTKVTLQNLRIDLTDAEVKQIVNVFKDLVKFPLYQAQVIITQRAYHEALA